MSIDQQLTRAGISADEIDKAAACLKTDAGRKLLEILILFRHPMASRFSGGVDALEAAKRDGQAEIIGFLWRHGSGSRLLPAPPVE